MVAVVLPTFLPDQVRAYNAYRQYRFLALRAGRRWGKTDFCKILACDTALRGGLVGWFAPDYKKLGKAFREIASVLKGVKLTSNQNEGLIRLRYNGGEVEFWTLDDDDAGRSRKYDLAVIDEGAFAGDNMIAKEEAPGIWDNSIKPTLLDRRGRCVVASNTNGNVPDNFLYAICKNKEHGFGEFHAPSHANPMLPREELEDLERKSHPLVFLQEYRAQFVDWSGVAFFSEDKLFEDGAPIAFPVHCDQVFGVLDTAIKDKSKNDGSGITFFAGSEHDRIKLAILDFDYIQMKGDSLYEWLPNQFEVGEALAARCGARYGFTGVFIEDMNTGSLLLQHGEGKGWPVQAIPSDFVAKDKDARAISISSHHYRGLIKVTREAYDKTLSFKGTTANHLMQQITGFRLGDPDAAKRADDLFDTYCYGVALHFGDAKGV